MKRVPALLATAFISVVVTGCASQGSRPLSAMEEYLARSSNPGILCRGDCGLLVQISDGCNFGSLRTMELEGDLGERTLTWQIDGPYKFSREDYKFGIVVRGDRRTSSEDPGDRIRDAKVMGPDDKKLTIRFDKRNRSDSGARTTITYFLNLLHESSTSQNKVWCEIHPWIVDR